MAAAAYVAPQRAPLSPGKRFKAEIEAALAEGYEAKDMTLRLNVPDAQRLLRDPDTATDDISFRNDEMRYLGVLVHRAGVTRSELRRGDEPEEIVPEPEVKPKKKTVRKAVPRSVG